MARDRWNVSEKWSIGAAAFYGALVGPPLQVVQNAIASEKSSVGLAENPEYLFWGLGVGAAAFMLVAMARNRLVLRHVD